jgi:5-methyltetrahydropteroyltriglutamate--homocysteine methyltransferase
MTPPYRAEVIGSMLRPRYLTEARKAWAAGSLGTVEFKRIEDRAVDAAIAVQEAVGLNVISDGEMRRSHFIGPLTDVLEGVEPASGWARNWRRRNAGTQAGDILSVPVVVTGKIRLRRSLVSEEFIYARARARRPLKATLPSPMMLALRWSPEYSRAAYPDPFKLFADAADIVREEAEELARLGCSYVQIDAPEIAMLVDKRSSAENFESRGISVERMLTEGIDLINSVPGAPGVTFGLHMCRGNNQGHWMSEGGYEAISKQVFRRANRFDVFLLEYDDWRSGSFEPLTDVAQDKRVVLGLISTKTEALEPADEVMARVEQAGRYFPRDQLALSTQCGFASVWEGNPVSEETQAAKLGLVASLACRLWP